MAIIALAALVGVLGMQNEPATAAALAVAVGIFLLVLFYALQLRLIALAVLFLALVSDNVAERPGMGIVQTPLYAPGKFLYTALSSGVGIPGVKFFGVEILLIVLLAHLTLIPAPLKIPTGASVEVFGRAARVSLAAVGLWTLYGLLRGGSLSFAILQVRAIFMSVALPLLWCRCFPRSSDSKAVLTVLVLAAAIRAVFCLATRAKLLTAPDLVADNLGGGFYVMTHSDSILWVSAFTVCTLVAIHSPRRLHAAALFMIAVLLLSAIVANNRRIAFVGLGASALTSYSFGPFLIRRLLHRAFRFIIPALLIYIAAGWSNQASWAIPVQAIQSIVTQQDSSSQTRDVENYNLTVTMKEHPFLGSGFGHEYQERVRMHDISSIFSGYRYIPHNSILGLFGFCGPIGFGLLWSPFVIAVCIACRASQSASTNTGVVVCLAAIAAVASHGVQAFGDMGAHSWLGALTLSLLIALALVEHGATLGEEEPRSPTARTTF